MLNIAEKKHTSADDLWPDGYIHFLHMIFSKQHFNVKVMEWKSKAGILCNEVI